MAKTKIERINSIEEQIAQLEAEKKKLRQQHKVQENKARTNRLCKRAGLLEKMLPDTIPLSDEQFKTFLEKAVANDFGRRMLANIAAQNVITATPAPTGAAVHGTSPPTAKSPQQLQLGGTGGKGGNGETASASG